jgi:glycosyltransferase involved in cell wall biosynthesis
VGAATSQAAGEEILMTDATERAVSSSELPARPVARKILLLLGYLWGGGAEWHALNLAHTLRNRLGVDVDVSYVLAPTADAEQAWRKWGFQPRRILTAGALRRLTRSNYDLIHAHLFKGELAGTLLSIATGVPLILTRHSLDWENLATWQQMVLRTFVQRRTRGIIAVSQAVADVTRKALGPRNIPLQVIHHGLDADLLRSRLRGTDVRKELSLEGKLLVGTAARLAPDKGLCHLLHAYAEVREALPDWHLVIAGDGPQRAELPELAARLGITARVHFLGWRQDALDVVKQLDLFVLPSVREGFGLALLEAMSLEVPCVASDLPGIREAGGDAVLYVRPADAGRLAAALEHMANHPGLRDDLARRGQRRSNEFGALEMARRTMEFYTHSLSHQAP